jgi:hypothetical protein
MIEDAGGCLQSKRRRTYHSITMNQELGRALIIFGLVIVVVGVLITFAGRIPLVGKLPGDVMVRKGNFTLYAPLMTGLILSLVLTIVLNLWARRH